MTIVQLKRTMDRRFDRIERTKANKSDVRKLRSEIRRLAAETRRHFDVIAESLRSDIRLLAEAVAGHSHRLDKHDGRITRLEQRI